MKVAQELDIKVPEDLKIIGYDGTYFVENYYPQLATIKQPLKDIAHLSVDLLLKRIAGHEVQTTGYFLPVSLLPGKSIWFLSQKKQPQKRRLSFLCLIFQKTLRLFIKAF